ASIAHILMSRTIFEASIDTAPVPQPISKNLQPSVKSSLDNETAIISGFVGPPLTCKSSVMFHLTKINWS
ncbi:MAG: hypothetical protein PWQ75_1389, partial [Methanolobus sp.]|nr:hypothetical protein [Methanolobus sp.]